MTVTGRAAPVLRFNGILKKKSNYETGRDE
jgi:hypothetical protein